MLLFLNVNCKDIFVKNTNSLCSSVSSFFPSPYFHKLTCQMWISSVLMMIRRSCGQGLLEYKPWGLAIKKQKKKGKRYQILTWEWQQVGDKWTMESEETPLWKF